MLFLFLHLVLFLIFLPINDVTQQFPTATQPEEEVGELHSFACQQQHRADKTRERERGVECSHLEFIDQMIS